MIIVINKKRTRMTPKSRSCFGTFTRSSSVFDFQIPQSPSSWVSPQQEIPFHQRLTFSDMSNLTYLEVLLF